MGACSGKQKTSSTTESKSDAFDVKQQVFLVGHPGVGKTSMLFSFVDGKFPEEDDLPVSDPKGKIMVVEKGSKKVKVQMTLRDTAGQEKFRTITSSFYGHSEGIIVVYDIMNKESFEQLDSWFKEVKRYAEENIVQILVGNKTDLLSSQDRAVTKEEAQKLAEEHHIPYFETSAKTSEGLNEMFEALSGLILSKNTSKGMGGTDNLE
eukprot:TRINITY_DN8241_c0_g1_i4.p1 TRINITY_DN8241_c0_g1~~TRINITY_DN8241_c0_g1_i4.p1  ORF type:complete len:207 (+),score=44.34 TRINITY_DN8241_c0_g1_i4:80-700(+)